MIRAEPTSLWARDHLISTDGREITTFSASWWSTGGRFALDGGEYEVRATFRGQRYAMAEVGSDAPAATAAGVGRRRWTLAAGGRTVEFRRASFLSSDQVMAVDGEDVGFVNRLSVWRGGAVADLPGLDVPVQVFAVAVVLTLWARAAAAAG
ncbi:MAG: hypothetical protein OJJ54_07945 [Pseudonocardia sp.]|nr:hypothetical protein [Pseudonocardia sp.]